MWCRAVLALVALTCTFDTIVQAHGPTQIKDIVCVLILNGLQKEDLDVNILKRLQRHNVNIEEMNNEALRKECETVTRKTDEPVTIKVSLSDLTEKQEEKIKLSDSNLQNIIINYFNNVQKTNKPNGEIVNAETESSTDLPGVKNFMNVWHMLSKTKGYDIETTTSPIQSFTAATDTTSKSKTRSDDKNIEYINKILEKLIAIQIVTTTSRPTTKLVDYNVIAQKIKEILSNTKNNAQSPSPTQSKVADDNVNEEIEVLHNDSIQYIDDIIKLTNPLKMFGPANNKTSRNRNIHFEDNNVLYQTKRKYLVGDNGLVNIITNAPIESQFYKKRFINKQIKSLSEDIIKEISESVRARVLQDLNKVLSTTKRTGINTRHTTVRTTTAKQEENDVAVKVKHEPNIEKMDATDVLEKFMEMFQQFKANADITEPNKFKINEDKNSKSENQVANLSAANIYNIKPLPVNITSVIINPFNPIHAPLIQTGVLPHEPYTLFNLNTPMQNIPIASHKLTQLNIFNTKNNYHTSPITIQTNSVEVPPLGLPAQQSVVYQNIVVSTRRPLDKGRIEFHQRYTPHDRKHYGETKHEELQRYSPQPRYGYSEFGSSRHDRSREFINNEYSKEINRRKPKKYSQYGGRPHYSDHNIKRFHEKLERTDDWPRISRSRENRNTDYDYGSPKLISRHQLPLGTKKRSRYDDSHFKNFLQTQQKVNDMLERILATKTNANRPRSVETTV